MDRDQFAQASICQEAIDRLPKNDPYVWHYQQLLKAWRRGDIKSGNQLKEIMSGRLSANERTIS